MKDHRLTVGRVFLLTTLLALLPASSTLADQTQIRNYRTARLLFWGRIHPEGGFTFYCGQEFHDRTDLNLDPKTVQDEVGHLDSRMTMDCYGVALRDPEVRAWAREHFSFDFSPTFSPTSPATVPSPSVSS